MAPEAARRNREQLARAGGDLREGRLARRISQAQAGELAAIGRGVVSRIERGLGASVPLDAWQRLGLAVGRPLVISVQRDVHGETRDTGHLAMQELVLRLGAAAGFTGSFELPTRPAEPWRSVDVCLSDPPGRRRIVVECWNTIGDIGAAVRSSTRKRAELQDLATATTIDGGSTTTGLVWVVRASARNRALVARYPEVFARAFPASSSGCIAALTSGGPLPADPGLVWSDVAGTRLFAWRRPRR
jgi:hypothetical protein